MGDKPSHRRKLRRRMMRTPPPPGFSVHEAFRVPPRETPRLWENIPWNEVRAVLEAGRAARFRICPEAVLEFHMTASARLGPISIRYQPSREFLWVYPFRWRKWEMDSAGLPASAADRIDRARSNAMALRIAADSEVWLHRGRIRGQEAAEALEEFAAIFGGEAYPLAFDAEQLAEWRGWAALDAVQADERSGDVEADAEIPESATGAV